MLFQYIRKEKQLKYFKTERLEKLIAIVFEKEVRSKNFQKWNEKLFCPKCDLWITEEVFFSCSECEQGFCKDCCKELLDNEEKAAVYAVVSLDLIRTQKSVSIKEKWK